MFWGATLCVWAALVAIFFSIFFHIILFVPLPKTQAMTGWPRSQRS